MTENKMCWESIDDLVDQLVEEYGWWNEHPKYPREEWKDEVASGNTLSGYWLWVANFIDSEGERNWSDYTVLMMLPEYLTNQYGEETFMDHTTAPTVAEAQDRAQKQAAFSLGEEAEDINPQDFLVIFACEGHVADVKVK